MAAKAASQHRDDASSPAGGPQSDPSESGVELIRIAVSQLSAPGRLRLLLATVGLTLISLLDLLGVMLLAYVGVAIVTLVGPGEVQAPVDLPGITDMSGMSLVALTLLAVAILALKSALSWLSYRRIVRFLAGQQALIAGNLFLHYMRAPLANAQGLSMASAVSGVIFGARATSQLLTALATLVADAALVFGLTLLIGLASPILLAFSVAYFGVLVFGLARVVGRASNRAAAAFTASDLKLSSTVIQGVGLSKEMRLYDLAAQRASEVGAMQSDSARAQASLLAWNQVPRYVLEIGLIVGVAGAGAIAISTQSPERAALSLGLFLVAASRLVPALQRVNASWGQFQVALGQIPLATRILNLPSPSAESPETTHKPLSGPQTPDELLLDDVSYTYPGAEVPALVDVNLRVAMPSRLALVGRSGAGKSTLAEVILGLIEPTSGAVVFKLAGQRVRPRVAFVAQEVFLINGTVLENITLESSGSAEDKDGVWDALKLAHADDIVRQLPQGLHTQLGERGFRLSGGQRQRLGMARALYRKPDVLVLDEATSALDSETEYLVTLAIQSISQGMAVISIAHRLSTIRESDVICYLEDGRLIDAGEFDDLCSRHPGFARAAELQGLVASKGGSEA